MASARADQLFATIDTDRNGSVSQQELLTYLLGVGVEQEEIAHIFAALDTDGDGRITPDEWRAGYARYVSPAEGRAILNCEFSFVIADKLRQAPATWRLSRFQDMPSDWLVRRTITFDDVIRGAYVKEYMVVSHRWETPGTPYPECWAPRRGACRSARLKVGSGIPLQPQKSLNKETLNRKPNLLRNR